MTMATSARHQSKPFPLKVIHPTLKFGFAGSWAADLGNATETQQAEQGPRQGGKKKKKRKKKRRKKKEKGDALRKCFRPQDLGINRKSPPWANLRLIRDLCSPCRSRREGRK